MADSSSRRLHRPATITLWLAALLACVFALNALSAWQTGSALDHLAVARLNAATTGAPLLAWPLTQADDVIAGRVFGRADFRFDEDGLHVVSAGDAVEIGVRLDHLLDLQRYPLVRVTVSGDVGVRFQWSAYWPGSTAPCRSPPLLAQQGLLESRLDQLSWECADSTTAPDTRYLRYLRLVIDGPAGASVRLRDLQIAAPLPLTIPALAQAPILAADSNVNAVAQQLLSLPTSALPVAIVPTGDWMAQGLARRQSLRELVPAVVMPSSTDPAPSSGSSPNLAKTITVALLVLLLGIWLRPPREPRWRAGAELLAAMLMPLWLSVGARLGTPMELIDWLFIGAGGVYLLLRIRDALPWHWLGSASAWQLPALSVLMALAFGLCLSGTLAAVPPTTADVVRYIAWAGLQQLILMTVVADRLSRIGCSTRWVVLASAVMFALLHSPNQSLMLLTLLGGLQWTWNWQRQRALLPNVVAHAACGLTATSLIGRDWLWSAEVGARFFAG